MQKNDIFVNYKSLYDLTSKTADAHIEFYKNKETIPVNSLFDIWKELSNQAENFDKHDWTQNWHNWHKNIQAFEGHKYEAKFLIQNYLTDVLKELITRLIKKFETMPETRVKHQPIGNLSDLIKQEVKRQISLELAKQKRKTKKILDK
ncbi:MAG: hypothetical protein WAO91_08875 [Candidatus Nitrosotenuis sp.]